MTTEFSIIAATTVSRNYSWDFGVPLTGNNIETIPVYSTTTNVTGCAPGIKARFKNKSTNQGGYKYRQFFWDFGDYYNLETNFLGLTCAADVEHTYIMPGEYTVTLYQLESRVRQDLDPNKNEQLCIGKYDIKWFWDNMIALSATWDQTKYTGRYAKWWDNELNCFAKYCKFWNWYDLQNAAASGANPVTWEQTYTGALFEKKWEFEANDTICKVPQEVTFIDTIENNVQVYTATAIVKVTENLPVANLYCFTQPTTGVTPFTVQMTSRGSVPGSYAINRIVWDPGDGTPIKTVWRNKTPNLKYFTYTNAFSADPADPRNYDLLHTYTRNSNTYPIFYPSIKIYSECTNTLDSCSITLGPVALTSINSQTHLLKIQNFNNNNMYALQYNNNIGFVTTNTEISVTKLTPNYPIQPIKNTSLPVTIYKGNSTDVFPTIFSPQC